MNKKAKLFLIISVIIIIVIILIALVLVYYFNKNESSTTTNNIPQQKFWNESSLASLKVNESVVNYILYSLEAYKLHKPPLSSNTPKIEILVDQRVFNSEVIKGRVYTKSGSINNEDIRMYMPRKEIINFLNSSNSISVLENSIRSGESRMEVIASYPTLLSKGYLNLYKKFTGKDLNEKGI
ncbi:hypothetical protein HYW74_00135 [Candidatus Pacearchaeota archaeon]|nr:hypothetical protein [Candidatus Pacearchaeota archaeon]